jgi:hypothetical protein
MSDPTPPPINGQIPPGIEGEVLTDAQIAQLTPEQRKVVAAQVYMPTITRMATLVMAALVLPTGNGDWTLWAPIATIDQVIHQHLDWPKTAKDESQRLVALQFVTLCHLALTEYGEQFRRYADTLRAYYAAGAVGPFPAPPRLEYDDIQRLYDQLEAQFPPASPAGAHGTPGAPGPSPA